jgi:hypothetical protein
MDVPLRSVDTPVANSPRDATASEPPRSTILAMVPPWRMLRRFCGFHVSLLRTDMARRQEGVDLRDDAYGVVFFNREFEVDDSRACCCHTELF